ncbi:hypothetical protein, partial [Mycobacteroides abscessus]|uniref:hypothetical protein n=1 Tax=Mycobacteroides abscessus TaxID=36809 RepID=UPI001A96A509
MGMGSPVGLVERGESTGEVFGAVEVAEVDTGTGELDVDPQASSRLHDALRLGQLQGQLELGPRLRPRISSSVSRSFRVSAKSPRARVSGAGGSTRRSACCSASWRSDAAWTT